MRLTLRTMLCYLDDVLKPEDAEEISKKIEESEFASGLVHRIRGSMRKLRLGAPKLDGKGVGLDSNTVAEYLDSTLASDRVPDFEKVCLESDVHLAEVASCHQILTLVLGEPADISVEIRDRMYNIPEEAMRPREQPTSAAPVTANAATVAAEPSDATKPESTVDDTPGESGDDAATTHEIPDYLKAGSKKRAVPLVASALLLFLALSIAYFAIGPKNVASWFGGDDETIADAGDKDTEQQPAKPVDPDDKNPVPAPDGNGTDDANSSTTDVPKGPDNQGHDPQVADKDGQENGKTDGNNDTHSGTGGTGETDGSPTSVKPPPDIKPVEVETKTPETDTVKPVTPVPVVKPPVTVETDPVDVGRFVSENQVLGRLDPKSGAWLRLASNEQLRSEDQLLVLPTFRPQMAFSSGLQLTVVGPAACTLTRPSDEGVPGIDLEYGRAIALTVSKPNSQLNVNLAGTRGTITFVQADSSVAFEVIRFLAPGNDPEATEARRIVQIFAPGAEIHWQPAEGEAVSLKDSEILVLSDGKRSSGALKVLPAWLEMSDVTDIDKIASEGLEAEVPDSRSLMLSLEELVKDNRVEVRMLAGRCLAYLDNFDAFVTMLSDKTNKSFWIKHIEAVREGLARGPESAKAVRVSFERIRGDKANELFRLVWGFSSGQLSTGADAQLVEYLSHEDLDFRVLVFENLRRITGKIGSYRPDVRLIERTPKINYWREKLANGEIVYRTPSVPRTLIPLE